MAKYPDNQGIQPEPDVFALESAVDLVHRESEQHVEDAARILHDDLGGLLVGASMDMAWIAAQPALSAAVHEKLARAQALLRNAVLVKRQLVEDLRPSLLENVGLNAALRWYLKGDHSGTVTKFTDALLDPEPELSAQVRVAVFRIFQDAISDVVSQGHTGTLTVRSGVYQSELRCELYHERAEPSGVAEETNASRRISMERRALQVGGHLTWGLASQNYRLCLNVPLDVTSS